MIEYRVITKERHLEQYYKLLEKMYTRTAPDFMVDEQEKIYNVGNGKIVCAIHDDEVVVGTRLVLSTPQRRIKLPLEEYDIDLAAELPHLHLPNLAYGEWGRLVAEPDFPDKKTLVDNVTRHCVNICLLQQCHYLFGAPSIMMHRRYEEIFLHMSLDFKRVIPKKEKDFFYDIIPGYPVYIAVTDLTKVKTAEYTFLPYDQTVLVS